jgi:acetylornithine/LysW-gamma-L-lysine aminotransferase
MVGVQLKRRGSAYLAALMDRGVLALPAGPVVMRFLPPLVISHDQLQTVADTVAEVLTERASRNG